MKLKWIVPAALPFVALVPVTAQTVRVQATPHAAGTIMAAKSGSYLGIGAEDIDAERAKTLNLKEVRGVEVTKVMDDSPAAKAGIKKGDVILEYNGQSVEGYEQLIRLLRETPVGHQARIVVSRNGATQTVTATLEASKNTWSFWSGDSSSWNFPTPAVPMPPMPPMEFPKMESIYRNPMLGIDGEALSEKAQFAEFLGVKGGVLVREVFKNSAAEKAGIKAGDVILKVDDSSVATTRDITSALRSARGKKTVNVTVVRNKKEMQLPVTLETSAERAIWWGLEGPIAITVSLPSIRIEKPIRLKLTSRDGVI
jgi:serine protease Do